MGSLVKHVMTVMERIAPLRLAEKWDKVGLVVDYSSQYSDPEPTESPLRISNKRQVLLTVDLTTEVCEEALASNTGVIVVYHPPIFSPTTSMTLSIPLQASLLKCVASGVSVFCPHTSLDSINGGINDWLALAFRRTGVSRLQPLEQKIGEEAGVGVGRMVTLEQPTPLATLIPDIKNHLGVRHVQVADAAKDVQTIAICAGSGGSAFGSAKADLYWTGEMSHHEILAAVARGTNVVLCGHSNTERGYLPLLQRKLTAGLEEEGVQDVEVVVSSKDKDPLTIL